MEAVSCPGCRERVPQLERRVAELEALVERLQQQLAEALRAGKRQAAPFRKRDTPRPNPKRPGRKAGDAYGTQGRREPPTPEQIDETQEAPLPDACPDCGGSVTETGTTEQFQIDLPRRPIHRRFHIHVGQCAQCGQRLQGRHPLQTSNATGAAAVQLGPDAQAVLTLANKDLGLSHGKCARLLRWFGIAIARATSARTMLRLARRCLPAYRALRQDIRGSPWVVPDETGWRVGGGKSWLHAFVGERATCYVIHRQRDHKPAEALLGSDWSGAMIHDGWAPYQRFQRARHQQCLQHVTQRCHDLLATARGMAARLPRQVLELWQAAFALRRQYADGTWTDDDLAEHVLGLGQVLDEITAGRFTILENRRLARFLREHRWQWFTFLLWPGIDATNYRAEQAIRPAVVNRKVWGGNRTRVGAWAQGVLMSVIRTTYQRGLDALTHLTTTLRSPTPVLIPT